MEPETQCSRFFSEFLVWSLPHISATLVGCVSGEEANNNATTMTVLERTRPPCWACSVMLRAASPSAEAHAQSQKIWSCHTECPSCVRHTLASPDLEWEAHGGCALPTCPRKLTVCGQSDLCPGLAPTRTGF